MHNVSPSTKVKPFLKWAGGKRWLVPSIADLSPTKYRRYFEPFLGSGAVFFDLCPGEAVLSDVNSALIETYDSIKENWKIVYGFLKEHHIAHNKEHYCKIRKHIFRCKFQRAAQFIYLNRTCWNGLYRVNSKGEFNVPVGTKQNVILDTDDFEKVADRLSNARLFSSDFEVIIDMAEAGDFLFIDPPYTVKHNNNNFVKYNEKLFSWRDQIRLRDAVLRACSRGASVLITNADHQCVKDLYKESFELVTFSRKSVIAADSARRGMYNELIIRRSMC